MSAAFFRADGSGLFRASIWPGTAPASNELKSAPATRVTPVSIRRKEEMPRKSRTLKPSITQQIRMARMVVDPFGNRGRRITRILARRALLLNRWGRVTQNQLSPRPNAAGHCLSLSYGASQGQLDLSVRRHHFFQRRLLDVTVDFRNLVRL